MQPLSAEEFASKYRGQLFIDTDAWSEEALKGGYTSN